MKVLKKIVTGVIVYAVIVALLFGCNVMWTSPSHYKVENSQNLEEPIMSMDEYDTIINTHRRPYIYSIKGEKGEVFILGVEHSKDPKHPQFEAIRQNWEKAKPTIALIEGRLGFLFIWFQDPIEKFGEGGLTSYLAKKNGADLYSWEPTRENEIDFLLEEFTAAQIAMFYSFRPYFSNMRYGKPDNPEKKLQEYLKSRTNYDHIRGIYKSWEDLDKAWQKDFPEINWRDYSDEYGWPEGYLSEMANDSNLSRDYHMLNIILELLENGETVFITMGASHAPRIEKTLSKALNSNPIAIIK